MPSPSDEQRPSSEAHGGNGRGAQLALFDQDDIGAARIARDDGIGTADANADPVWKRWARVAVSACAADLTDFTADDVWAWLATNAPAAYTPTPAALGPVLISAARDGEIRKTGEMRPTRYRRRHRDLTVWCAT